MSKAKEFIIYALHHDDSDYMYVGRSSKGLARPQEHGEPWSLKRCAHYPVAKWILKHRESGQPYHIAVLEQCASVGDLNEAEMFHIAYLRSVGVPLLNCTDGGGGISGHHFSDQTRAQMSLTRRGRRLSQATKNKLSIANTGKKMSPDAIERTAAAHRGVKRSEETCRRLSESHQGKINSPECRAKIAAANRRRVYKGLVAKARSLGVIGAVVKSWRKELGLSAKSASRLLGACWSVYRLFENEVVTQGGLK